MDTVKIAVRIPERLGNEVEKLAKDGQRSKASILKEALEAYIGRHAHLIEQGISTTSLPK